MSDQNEERRKGLKGRVAWALNELERHPAGIRSMQYPGVRLSDAIFKLRKAGYAIETIREHPRASESIMAANSRGVTDGIVLSQAQRWHHDRLKSTSPRASRSSFSRR